MPDEMIRRSWLPPAFRGWVGLLALWPFLLLVVPTARAQTPIWKSILIINEVGLAHPASALVTQQVMSRLAADRRFQTEFYVESLDSPLFSDGAPQQLVEARLIAKYEKRNIDVIVAMGPAPIRFLAEHGNFLPNVPVVFCGSTQVQTGDMKLSPRFTGSWMDFQLAKTLEAARLLVPDTKKVVVVSGSSQYDKATLKLAKASLVDHPVPLEFTYLTDLDMSGLLEQLRHLQKGTIVLYLSFFRDARGSHFVNATTALPLVSEASNAPVFGVSDTLVGHGIVGGYVVSFADQGKIAAGIVAQIVQGKPPAEIPIITAPSVYMFDWMQLKRWNLSESRLPAGSIVLNREGTAWQQAKWILLPTAGLTFRITCPGRVFTVRAKAAQPCQARADEAQRNAYQRAGTGAQPAGVGIARRLQPAVSIAFAGTRSGGGKHNRLSPGSQPANERACQFGK